MRCCTNTFSIVLGAKLVLTLIIATVTPTLQMGTLMATPHRAPWLRARLPFCVVHAALTLLSLLLGLSHES